MAEQLPGLTWSTGRAIAAGLESQGLTTLLADVVEFPDGHPDLVVLAATTHPIQLRPVAGTTATIPRGPVAAVFGARTATARHLPFPALRLSVGRVERASYRLLVAPQVFTVTDLDGHLGAAEQRWAQAWGAEVARRALTGPIGELPRAYWPATTLARR